MSAYFVLQVDIHDQAEYDRYREEAGSSTDGIDFKIVAADSTPQVLEGKWPGSTIILEFPDEAEFRKWYDSPRYQAALKVRIAATDSNGALLNGFEA